MISTVTARWETWSDGGLEHLVLKQGPEGPVAEAVVLASSAGEPFAARYRIACDRAWQVRQVDVRLIGADKRIALTSDGAGRWTDAIRSAPLAPLNGAIDVDISITPFTNSLPIRRLALAAGESAEILTVYIRLPELSVQTDAQRYRCIEPRRRYLYRAVDNDFSREIEVDDEGLVTVYPGLFRRVI